MPPTDAELIARSRRDPDAFADLVDRHKHQVVGYLARLTGCRDRAEDLAQEAFVRCYQKLDGYREEGAFRAYLFRIATNLLRSEERRKRRWRILRPVFSHTVETNGNGHHRGPQGDLLAGEEQRQVGRALAALDLLYRAPLVLREIEGLTYGEISRALGCREGTVKSRLHRGRQLLRDQLAPYWNGGSPS